MKIHNYYVINLESVDIEKNHPYTLIFKGYIPTYGGNKLYTFKYDGQICYTDAMLTEKIKKDFAKQLYKDYGCGIMFDLQQVIQKLNNKFQYRIEM